MRKGPQVTSAVAGRMGTRLVLARLNPATPLIASTAPASPMIAPVICVRKVGEKGGAIVAQLELRPWRGRSGPAPNNPFGACRFRPVPFDVKLATVWRRPRWA